jgi:Xaa-Pro aminopeptidase
VTDDVLEDGPVPFTADDFAARRVRAATVAQEAGLTGLLLTPGPDLMYFTGYAPVAITERITMLVIPVDADPTMIVPRLERPDAENAAGVADLQLVDRADGSDPYEASGDLLANTGRYAISDSAWSMHLLGLQGQLPDTSYVSLTSGLPMLRAVKDAAEVERLSAAGAAADRAYEEILRVHFAGRRDGGGGRSGRAAPLLRALAGRLHGGGIRPQRGQPSPRDRRAGHRAGRHGRARLRRSEVRLRVGHDTDRARG